MGRRHMEDKPVTHTDKTEKKLHGETQHTMAAKEYLQQLHRADVIISQKTVEKEEIRNKVKSIVCPDTSNKSANTDRRGLNTGYAEKLAGLVALEDEIDRMTVGYVNLKHRIICQIHNLDNADQIKVLYKRYVGLEKFEQIADDLNFSIRNVYVIHGQALQQFQKKCMQQ